MCQIYYFCPWSENIRENVFCLNTKKILKLFKIIEEMNLIQPQHKEDRHEANRFPWEIIHESLQCFWIKKMRIITLKMEKIRAKNVQFPVFKGNKQCLMKICSEGCQSSHLKQLSTVSHLLLIASVSSKVRKEGKWLGCKMSPNRKINFWMNNNKREIFWGLNFIPNFQRILAFHFETHNTSLYFRVVFYFYLVLDSWSDSRTMRNRAHEIVMCDRGCERSSSNSSSRQCDCSPGCPFWIQARCYSLSHHQ